MMDGRDSHLLSFKRNYYIKDVITIKQTGRDKYEKIMEVPHTSRLEQLTMYYDGVHLTGELKSSRYGTKYPIAIWLYEMTKKMGNYNFRHSYIPITTTTPTTPITTTTPTTTTPTTTTTTTTPRPTKPPPPRTTVHTRRTLEKPPHTDL